MKSRILQRINEREDIDQKELDALPRSIDKDAWKMAHRIIRKQKKKEDIKNRDNYGQLAMKIREDAPVNNAGSGNIAGIGVPNPSKPANWGEPGVSVKNQKKHRTLLRRKAPKALAEEIETGKFAGNDTFVVPSDLFFKARVAKKHGKHWKTYIGNDDHGMAIRDYANKNKKKPIILQDTRTGVMHYARYGRK